MFVSIFRGTVICRRAVSESAVRKTRVSIPQGMTASFLTCPLLSHHLWIFQAPVGVHTHTHTCTHTPKIILCRVLRRGPQDPIQDPLPTPTPPHLPGRSVSPSTIPVLLWALRPVGLAEPWNWAGLQPNPGSLSPTWASGTRRAMPSTHAKGHCDDGPPSYPAGSSLTMAHGGQPAQPCEE